MNQYIIIDNQSIYKYNEIRKKVLKWYIPFEVGNEFKSK